ncbi:MAG: nucleoside kinase [Candidatus Didemnitutus sp.]|nr:nucleoside kinase [Candidatus Didemnitutus sp.]
MSEPCFVPPSEVVEFHLPDGRVMRGARGESLEKLLQPLRPVWPSRIVGAIVNGELRELTHRLELEARVRPVAMTDADGARIYRRSLTFLLCTAFSRQFPGASLHVDHALSSGGYYCEVRGRAPLSADELAQLRDEMRRLVAQDLPFQNRRVPVSEAIEVFEARGAADKVRLLRHRKSPTIDLYQVDGYVDYHHGYMVPSTGYLEWFDLVVDNGGFALLYPRQHAPKQPKGIVPTPKLLAAFRQYGDWLDRLGIGDVGALVNAIQANRAREIMLVSEALHEQHIASIAQQIAERGDGGRLVLISGPSSSGKTTFSRRLAVQLLARGLSPFALEMDNYFVERERTPRDADGKFDFETIGALNLELLAEHLAALLEGREVQLPRYNFVRGRPETGDVVRLRPGQIVILEGIHGLNPALVPPALAAQAFRVFASALTQLSLDRHNRLSTTDTRLVRRIVRDARDRGYSATDTLSRWESVRRGEKLHIFPHQENADAMFNSALVYELAALRPIAEPLLRQVPHGTPEHVEAVRLLALLQWFAPIDAGQVPENSILREFLGGSSLRDFKAWGG